MSKRIMVVDDSRLVRVQMEDALAGTEYEVAAYCRSGEDAIARYAEVRPDLVTMDEVGCGILPLERKARQYRDMAGAAGQMLAASARKVYRGVAGIPVRIR